MNEVMGPDNKVSPAVLERMVREICRLRPVAIYLFGSQVTGSARPDSDIDLAVLLPSDRPELPIGERMALVGALEQLTDRQVDLVILNQAPLPLQFEIIHTGKILYEADVDARTTAEDIIVRDYLDLQPMYERSYRETIEDYQKEGE